MPESTGEATPAFLLLVLQTLDCRGKGAPFTPVLNSGYIPKLHKTRTRCAVARRTSVSLSAAENGPSTSLPVLHWLPPQGLRGRSLQFQSFDGAYLDRLRAGDYRAQEHFCAYFSALIQIKLRSRLNSSEAVEDVRQETFARFFVALREGKILQPERLGPYVNSICNNVLLEYYRGAARYDSLEEGEAPEVVAPGIDQLGVISAKEREEKVREILENLPERDRRLLREVFLEERDKDEVCRDYGVDREYLRVLLHRAKQSFKAGYLKKMGEPPEFSPA
jgi:RNA polymerase sigma-70 factor, ECF subfamily